MHSIYVCINNMHSIQQLLYFSRKLAKHHRPSMISAHTSYDPKASTRITQLLRDMIAAVEDISGREGKDTFGSFAFSPLPSSGRPGSPHRYFESSYECVRSGVVSEGKQVVHSHANGLCVVTAGDLITMACHSSAGGTSAEVASVDFQVKPCADQSVGAKRRRQKSKKAKDNLGGNNGFAQPSHKLAVVHLSDGRAIDLFCCVQGTILEINGNLLASGASIKGEDPSGDGGGGEGSNKRPSLLLSDPLLDGYLAIIMTHKSSFPSKEN